MAPRPAERGAAPPPLLHGDWTARSGYATGVKIAGMPSVTAVLAANDQMATGVLLALHERGRRVPADVSVVGFDDTPEAAYLIPPLTTMRQDLESVGRLAVAMLLDEMTGRPTARTRNAPSLRSSCATARGLRSSLVPRVSHSRNAIHRPGDSVDNALVNVHHT